MLVVVSSGIPVMDLPLDCLGRLCDRGLVDVRDGKAVVVGDPHAVVRDLAAKLRRAIETN